MAGMPTGSTSASSTRATPPARAAARSLVERAHGWWYGRIHGVGVGQRYGVRAAGPWRPDLGLRYNEAKLLLDPLRPGDRG